MAIDPFHSSNAVDLAPLVRFAGEILYRADEIHVHDGGTKKKT
jgi:hypothetical protein